jgi:transcriptional regulator with XRE-family HTH domain
VRLTFASCHHRPTLQAGDDKGNGMVVQKLRLKRGWSQQQLAELSGLSVRTIQRIEGGSPASTETLKSLASVFEIDFSELTQEQPMPEITHSENEERLALAHVRRVKGFYIHLSQYVVVITGLFLINLATSHHVLWAIWPAIGWGIGITAHAMRVFGWMPYFGPEWERRQVEKRLGRPL